MRRRSPSLNTQSKTRLRIGNASFVLRNDRPTQAMKHSIPFSRSGFLCLRFAWLVLVAGIVVSGCVSKNSRQGVENKWRSETAPVFKQGVSTEHDVLASLGPPSQLINLGSQTVFYYLQEQKQTRSLILVLYNQTREQITYDRAIFFFDQQGHLTDFATSDEKTPAK